MQFTKTLALLAAAVAASADTVELWVRSDDAEIDGKGLSALHEGAGISYYFLGDNATSFSYDPPTGAITQPINNGVYMTFGAMGSYVAISVVPPFFDATFDADGTLEANGTSAGFFACKNTGDEYQYSVSQWEVMYYPENDAPQGCVALTIANAVAPPTNSSTVPPTNTTTVAPTTVPSSSELPTSTDQTTTLVTVTSCSSGKCTESSTSELPASTSETSSTSEASSTSETSTSASSVSSFAGAAINAVEPASAAALCMALFAALL
ncbi:DEKNAAC105327 [Brettanomyces naardenensis]|uniref:DEKNAAC105327 n=1 Tax=Brettanomyces naardenensis TaxID=13370 RepID=A0A448YTG7_BRENA|nr:DEKNAAC105327 [Brettanomyces naardenensis]